MRYGNTLLVLFLMALLGGTGVFVYQGVAMSGPNEMSIHGYIAMTLGIIFSLVIGAGLMALVFYSSRYGYDDPLNASKQNPARRPPPGK